MNPILNLSFAAAGRDDMLCLLNRGEEPEGEDEDSSAWEGSNDESKRRERSLIVTSSGKSLDD